jgi:hypothetical protein
MAKTLAHGCQLLMGDGATPTEGFDDVPNVSAIEYPHQDAELVDVTTHTEDAREEIAGLPEIYELGVTLVWDVAETTHVAIRDVAVDAEASNWQIITKSGTTFQFAARVRARSFALDPINKAETMSFKLRVYSVEAPADA